MTSVWRQIFDLLGASAGASYVGEPVSQLEHALQCAHFARAAGAGGELVLAALLHDIGHLLPGDDLDGLGVVGHEEVGARFLEEAGAPPRVVELVRGHVAAKRWLARMDVHRRRLSDASRRTLELQGGPMTDGEARAFEADPLIREKVQLRKLDELAKQPGLEVAPLPAYAALVWS